jgi:predicted small lipoprotein YifL
MRYKKHAATVAALLLLLWGCGQRGALYLPENAPTSNQSAEQEPSQAPSSSVLEDGQ